MAVATRQGLIDYCLRELGEPVVEINVDDGQVEDRVDEALEFFRLYHYDGIEKVYLKQQIRASSLNLSTSVATSFQLEDLVTGQTSGATARVTRQWDKESSGTDLLIRNVTGTFVAGETISTGGTSPTTAVLAATTPFVLREFDLKYLELPDSVYGVVRMLPHSNTSTSRSMFDVQYQLRLNDLYDLASTSIIYYKQVMGHLALLDLELNGRPMIRFNRMNGRVYPDINWSSDITLGDYFVIECYRALDPNTFTRVWNEPWLKKYTTALIKRQWGANGKKFQGLVLPGGVSIDFQGLYAEAITEIKELEEELMLKSAPLDFFLG